MKMARSFCEHCDDFVDYKVKRVSKKSRIKGIVYEYMSLEASCVFCGAPVFAKEVNDSNLQVLQQTVRENKIKDMVCAVS